MDSESCSKKMNPYNAGWDAAEQGIKRMENPYTYGMSEYDEWERGFSEYQNFMVESSFQDSDYTDYIFNRENS